MINQKNIHLEVEKLKKENELMRLLGSKEGFFKYYFNLLPKHTTRNECFNMVNESFYNLFGFYKYTSFYSFSNQYLKYRKKKK